MEGRPLERRTKISFHSNDLESLELENGLLRLKQFQHILDEPIVAVSKTEERLRDLTHQFGDPLPQLLK